MQLTSKDANKLLRQFEDELHSLRKAEGNAMTWVASISENKEDVRPDYDYEKVQSQIKELESKVRKLKHALNLFNVQTIVPGFNKTIDEMLVYIPQLTSQKSKLLAMKETPKFAREEQRFSRVTSIIEYRYVNYDLEKVAADYLAVSQELAKAQFALDKVNISELLEVEV